jgi:flagellar basal-body rod modification protein FlgD
MKVISTFIQLFSFRNLCCDRKLSITKAAAIVMWHNNCFFWLFVARAGMVRTSIDETGILERISLFFEKGRKVMDPVSATNTASSIQMDYMKLLITQLQNQNPLEPLDNNEMASQLAQISQLQQLESMNESFAKVLATTELTYANSLLGKEVTFMPETETGTTDITSGIVEQVYNNIDGEIFLRVGNHTLGLKDVISVNE